MWLLRNYDLHGLQCLFQRKRKKNEKVNEWYHREKIIYPVLKLLARFLDLDTAGGRMRVERPLVSTCCLFLRKGWFRSGVPHVLSDKPWCCSGQLYWLWKALLSVAAGLCLGRHDTIAHIDINLYFSTREALHFIVCKCGWNLAQKSLELRLISFSRRKLYFCKEAADSVLQSLYCFHFMS